MKILLFEQFNKYNKLQVGKSYTLKNKIENAENTKIATHMDIEAGAEITIKKIKKDIVEFTVEPISNNESWLCAIDDVIKSIFESNDSKYLKKTITESSNTNVIKHRDLIIGNKYTWYKGAEPLECEYVEFDEDKFRYKFIIKGNSQGYWLSMRDVKDYIYPYSVYLKNKK